MKNTTERQGANSILTLENAIASHQSWKTKLINAAISGQQLDVATIKRDDCCDLGTWLHGDGMRLYGGRPEFTNLIDKHKSFHVAASEVAGIINTEGYEPGRTQLRGGSPFIYATIEVIVAINLLKAVVGGSQEP